MIHESVLLTKVGLAFLMCIKEILRLL